MVVEGVKMRDHWEWLDCRAVDVVGGMKRVGNVGRVGRTGRAGRTALRSGGLGGKFQQWQGKTWRKEGVRWSCTVDILSHIPLTPLLPLVLPQPLAVTLDPGESWSYWLPDMRRLSGRSHVLLDPLVASSRPSRAGGCKAWLWWRGFGGLRWGWAKQIFCNFWKKSEPIAKPFCLV